MIGPVLRARRVRPSGPVHRGSRMQEPYSLPARSPHRTLLLVIEEAHCLPTATLKHLKRFLELKDGMQRLIGVALIAQPDPTAWTKARKFAAGEAGTR